MALSPNYKEYTLEQLRDVQSVIDSKKYPERAAEIERLIAEKLANPEIKIETFDTSKRPKWVWGISIFYSASLVFGLFFHFSILSGKKVLPDALTHYISDLGWVYWAMIVVSMTLSISAVITLFRLNKVTVRLWLAVFLYSVLSQAFSFLSPAYQNISSLGSVIGSVFNFAIIYAIYAYTKRLASRGYLS